MDDVTSCNLFWSMEDRRNRITDYWSLHDSHWNTTSYTELNLRQLRCGYAAFYFEPSCVYISKVVLRLAGSLEHRNSATALHAVFSPSASCATKGKDKTPRLSLPRHLLSLTSPSIVSLYPLFLPFIIQRAHTYICSSHTSTHTQFVCHTVAHALSFAIVFFFGDLSLPLCVWLCSCDPCSTSLFYDSGPRCHSNLPHHKEQTLEILWHT